MKTQTISQSLTVLVVVFIAGCGGGGGSNVSSLDGAIPLGGSISGEVSWLANSTVNSTIGGVLGTGAGIRLSCALESGSVPTGMALQSNCNVVGTPTEIESKTFTVRVSSSDASGAVSRPGTITVKGPSLAYDTPLSYIPSDNVRLSLTQSWPGLFPLRYEFDGTAPPGLTIDSNTGTVIGNIGIAGASFNVALNVQTPAKAYRIVGPGVSAVPESPQGLGFVPKISVWAGLPFTLKPVLPTGAIITSANINWPIFVGSLSTNVIPGIVVDPVSSALGGTPSAGTDDLAYPVNVDVNWVVGGVAANQRFQTNIVVKWPVEVSWPTACFINTSCNAAPQIIVKAPYAFDGAIFSYELLPGAALANGLTLDPSTGVINGTPLVGTFNFTRIKVTVSQAGKVFVITRSFGPVIQKPAI
jgi:Putative Ig domain